MANADAKMTIEVAWSPAPRDVRLVRLRLSPGATATDAVRVMAVWGRACAGTHELREGDRVEILRRLAIDPMEARRDRYEAAGGVQALRRKRQALQPKKGRSTSRSSAR